VVTKETVRKCLADSMYEPSILKELVASLGLRERKEHIALRRILKELEEEGEVHKDGKGRYHLAKTDDLKGRIEFTRSGTMGFVRVNAQDEYVVFLEDAKGAMHRDQVVIRPTGYYRDWRKAEVVRVLQRNLTRVVGVLVQQGKKYFVIPDDKKLGLQFVVDMRSKNDLLGAIPGQKVFGDITMYPHRGQLPKMNIREVLGDVEDPRIHTASVILKHGLPFPEEFPEPVLQEAGHMGKEVSRKAFQSRADFREHCVVTIDGEDSKDFDDAVCMYTDAAGKTFLEIHIADVAHYVQQDRPLDKEAYKRATSVYLLNQVIPMLPKVLSNGLCSLQEGKDRLVVSLVMEILPDGSVGHFDIHEGVIRSQRRLTYTQVNQWLEDRDPQAKKELEQTKGLLDMLEAMEKLSQTLRENRRKRGAIINIGSDEVAIQMDDAQHTVAIIPQSRHVGQSIIEEFMILANETIARHFQHLDLPFVYRIHEPPDAETLIQLKDYIRALGIQHRVPKKLTSTQIQKLLETLKDHPLLSSVERLVVRSMKRAVYATGNVGHYGLASEAYTHFTSPIRRYPDLMVHRLLKEIIRHGTLSSETIPTITQYLSKVVVHCSQKERVANEAEWDLIALKKVDYISRHQSEVFDVVITHASKFGLFVEIPGIQISGLIHISSLEDYFVLEETQNALVGERTGKVYRLGDVLKARVKDIDRVRGEIDFEIVHQDHPSESKTQKKRR